MPHDEGNIVKDLDPVDGLGQVGDGQHFVADLSVRTEIDIGIFTAGRLDLIQLDLFKGTFTAGRLFGFGSVGGETGNEFLEFLDLFLFLLVGFLHLPDHQLAGLVPEIIVAGIELDLAVIDVRDIGTYLVQEIPVVGNNDDRVVEVDQEFLQPGDGVQIQMVGRLVQQQDVGVAEQGPGQQDLDLLGTGQLAHQVGVELGLNAQTVEQGLRVGFRFPAVHFGKFRLQLAGPDTVFIGKVLFGVKSVLFLHDLEQTAVALDDRIQYGLAVVFVVVLLQERQSLPGRHGHGAVGGIQLAGQDLEEGGFARAVCADNAVAVAFREFNGNIFKKRLLTQSQCNAVCLNHAASFIKALKEMFFSYLYTFICGSDTVGISWPVRRPETRTRQDIRLYNS